MFCTTAGLLCLISSRSEAHSSPMRGRLFSLIWLPSPRFRDGARTSDSEKIVRPQHLGISQCAQRLMFPSVSHLISLSKQSWFRHPSYGSLSSPARLRRTVAWSSLESFVRTVSARPLCLTASRFCLCCEGQGNSPQRPNAQQRRPSLPWFWRCCGGEAAPLSVLRGGSVWPEAQELDPFGIG